MSSTYPTSLDAFSTAHADGTNEIIHASSVNDLADAVNKIETELGTLPKGGSADVKARIAATETVANAAVPKSTVTTAGDLIYGTGSAAVSRLAAGSAGQTLVTGATPSWAYPPAYEFDHATLTTDLSVTGTTTGSPTTAVTGSAVTYDGSTAVWIDFSCYAMTKGTTKTNIAVYEDGVYLKDIIDYFHTTTGPAYGRLRRTPTAGSHTYSIRAYVDAGTGNIFATSNGPAEMTVRKI